MSAAAPGVYVGTLRHRRREPVRHEFTYPVFMTLLDIDRLPELMQVSPFTSYERWNWASFRERDHLAARAGRDAGAERAAGAPTSLRARLGADAARHGVDLGGGPVFLLTHLRYLGYCFNPVSFFYCFDRHDTLRFVLAETNNTFGGSHNYWLRRPPSSGADAFRAVAAKSLYVSPFMEAELDYRFTFGVPGDRLLAHMENLKDGRAFFDATLVLERRDWSAREIRRALVAHPWMTARVIAGIHWQALRLWWKGVPPVARLTSDGVGEREAAARARSRADGEPAARLAVHR